MITRVLLLMLAFSASSLAQTSDSDASANSAETPSIQSGSAAPEAASIDALGNPGDAVQSFQGRNISPDKSGASPINAPEFRWKSAVTDSFKVLMLQNALRIAIQQKTRDGLHGPFFPDYAEAVKAKQSPNQIFMDGDSWGTNFILHPIQGSTVYHVARRNGASRTQAFLWGVGYSTQFEFGPLGEAGIGNVGRSPVDLVVTPTVGALLGITEEWLMAKLDKRMDNKVTKLAKSLLVGNLISRIVVGH